MESGSRAWKSRIGGHYGKKEMASVKTSKRDLLEIVGVAGAAELQPPIRPLKWVPIELIAPWRCNDKGLCGFTASKIRIREFVEAMRRGDQFPPIVAFPYRKKTLSLSYL
jgi:hypothetical protein